MGVVLQDVPASDVLRQFRPWKWLAIGILFVTGIFLTLSDPVEYHDNIMFWMSLGVLALAGWNAWKFHNGVYRCIVEWDNADPAPRDARLWALRSLTLWTSLIFISRAIAFF